MIKIGRVIFKDYYCFCPQKLANLPASFGFEDKVTKGHYPWRYPNRHNLKSPGRFGLPARWYYGVDLFRTEKETEEFENWYQENENSWFHFQTEAIHYCLADAEILARAVQSYITMGLKISGKRVNPITADGCLTLAGFVSLVYRACFMRHGHSIGIIPTNGYNSDKRQSTFACKTLDWLNQQRAENGQPLIRHKFHGGLGEKKIGSCHLDGWIEETRTGFQVVLFCDLFVCLFIPFCVLLAARMFLSWSHGL